MWEEGDIMDALKDMITRDIDYMIDYFNMLLDWWTSKDELTPEEIDIFEKAFFFTEERINERLKGLFKNFKLIANNPKQSVD